MINVVKAKREDIPEVSNLVSKLKDKKASNYAGFSQC